MRVRVRVRVRNCRNRRNRRQSRRRRRSSARATRSSAPSATKRFPPAYLEYGRCLVNAPSTVSKTTKADVKDFVLRLYNLRTTTDLPRLDASLTLQAQADLRAMLRHVSTGNAYGGLVQTLLAFAQTCKIETPYPLRDGWLGFQRQGL